MDSDVKSMEGTKRVSDIGTQSNTGTLGDRLLDLQAAVREAILHGSNRERRHLYQKMNRVHVGFPVSVQKELLRNLVYAVYSDLKRDWDDGKIDDTEDYLFVAKKWSAFFAAEHKIYWLAIRGFLLAKSSESYLVADAMKVHNNLKPIFQKDRDDRKSWRYCKRELELLKARCTD